MRHLNKSNALIMMGVILGIFSCQPEDIVPDTNNAYLEASGGRMIRLGKKLENPFSLHNMKKAAENLASSNNGKKTKIIPTHLYVKFKPASREELELLHTSDSTLILFNYPLDYEITQNGSYYHDPEVPLDRPTYQYTSVPIDYSFPANVDYEILEEVYIPQDDQNNNDRTADDAMALEHEAYRITGNLPDEVENDKPKTNGRTEGWFTWRPSGHLRVWDDIIGSNTTCTRVFSHWEYYDCDQVKIEKMTTPNVIKPPIEGGQCKRAVYNNVCTTKDGSYIPLEGVLVRAHTFVKIAWGTTNVNGDFSVNITFAKWEPVQYSILWETTKYAIFEGSSDLPYNLGVPAFHNGPLKNGSWIWDISSGRQHGFATMHRAGYRYHYKNIGGLRRPGVIGRLALSWVDGNGTGRNTMHYWQQVLAGSPIPNIIVWSKENGVNKISNKVFGSTIHEIGHASHIEVMKAAFRDVDLVIKESWAEAIEWYITNIEYTDDGVVNYDNPSLNNFTVNGRTYHQREHYQWWTSLNSHDYTPLFIDMVDGYNQRIFKGTNFPDDRIVNYTMGGIEGGFLKDVYNTNGLRTQLQGHRPSGVTPTQIDNYMNYYNW